MEGYGITSFFMLSLFPVFESPVIYKSNNLNFAEIAIYFGKGSNLVIFRKAFY